MAATGIGKTYLAVFDSLDFHRNLFVAHREEILIQAELFFKNISLNIKTGLPGNNIINLKDFISSQCRMGVFKSTSYYDKM